MSTVWRLRGSTDKIVAGILGRTTSRAHVVTVVLGADTFLYETYPDAASAMGRAMQVRDALLKSGVWALEPPGAAVASDTQASAAGAPANAAFGAAPTRVRD